MVLATNQSILEQSLDAIKAANSIAIIPHRSPDGDAIGSALALKLAIRQLDKLVAETVCIDQPPKNTKFLPEADLFKNDLDISKYDLLVFVDCGGFYMSKFHEKIPNLFNGSIKTLNIDHHGSNEFYATLNIVEPTMASTTHILYHLFQKWGIKITTDIATCLLTGLYFDTGSFRHNNTSTDVLQISGDLLKKGADFASITKYLFKDSTINRLKLWGIAMNNVKRTTKSIVTSAVTKEDYKKSKASSKDLEGVIDYLNAVPDSKFCMLLSEDQSGGVKASLRTQNEEVDLSKLAEVFGGGGHKMASGFRIEGKISEEKHWNIK
jgi:phosphoesterase RecJ-like protein